MFGRKVSFGVTWSVIACASIFCFYASQILIVVSVTNDRLSESENYVYNNISHKR